jgi:hypothetical protein
MDTHASSAKEHDNARGRFLKFGKWRDEAGLSAVPRQLEVEEGPEVCLRHRPPISCIGYIGRTPVRFAAAMRCHSWSKPIAFLRESHWSVSLKPEAQRVI